VNLEKRKKITKLCAVHFFFHFFNTKKIFFYSISLFSKKRVLIYFKNKMADSQDISKVGQQFSDTILDCIKTSKNIYKRAPSCFLFVDFIFANNAPATFAKRIGDPDQILTHQGIREYFLSRIANNKNTLTFGPDDTVTVTWRPSKDAGVYYCYTSYEAIYIKEINKILIGTIYQDLLYYYKIPTTQFKVEYFTCKTIDLHLQTK
jgi:hypothetical protein